MAAKAGKSGKVMSGASTLAFVESWELSIDDEALETTGMGASARSHIGRGLYNVKGSVKFKALDNADAGVATIRAAILDNTTALSLKLYEDGTKYWSGNGIIVGMPQSSTLDGLVTGSFEFVGTGAWTYN